ncbi:hypothetical protein FQA39_LY11329 [Lamprigera yunnana]|nr:hypothetical protein FQA39_LY11329 [Lamprigera yunnana]
MQQILLTIVVLYSISIVNLQRIPYTYNNLNQVPILKLAYEPNPDGSYSYNYETGNAIVAQQRGYLKNVGNPQTEAQVVEGSYSYIGPDGIQYTVTYFADENGFHAEGAHIPKASSIPLAIQRTLDYNALHPNLRNRFKYSK